MRIHRNHEKTSFISVKAYDRTDESGLFIQQSTKSRVTENEALSPAQHGKPHHIVTDMRPGLDYHYCDSCGEYVHSRGFTPDKRNRNGLDYVCKSCRAEQRQRHRQAEREQWLSRKNG